ncbi:MAG: 50S ribosomal protein L17 [Chloroflexi bacterium]|jgi:large subunit ribosomal protein L17|nr:50S ribosomal protein L17 [Chloroflexota bacterium]
MRHQVAGKKLGRSSGQRTALRKTLVNQLLLNDRIRTTRAKAQAIRGEVEGLVTRAKHAKAEAGTMVHARRIAASRLGNPEAVKRLFDEIAPRFEKRSGGYTRILRLGHRLGDAAELVLLEFVEG